MVQEKISGNRIISLAGNGHTGFFVCGVPGSANAKREIVLPEGFE